MTSRISFDDQLMTLHSLREQYVRRFGKQPTVWLGYQTPPSVVENILRESLETGQPTDPRDVPEWPEHTWS